MRIELVNLDSVVKTWSAVPWVQSLVEALASCFSLPTSAAVLSTFWVWSKPSYQNLGFQMLKVPSDFRDGAVCSAPRVSGCCWTPFFFLFFCTPQVVLQLLKAPIRFCLQDTGGRCFMPQFCSRSVSLSVWYDLFFSVKPFQVCRVAKVLHMPFIDPFI